MNQPLDMSRFIEVRSDQLNSDDLIGRSITVTVTKVAGCEGEQPVAIYFEGDNGKPFKPCKTIRRVLVAAWGANAAEYVGRSMTLYRDDAVTFGGLQTGGIRISHLSHIDKEMLIVVMKSKGKKAGVKILPLVVNETPKPDPAVKYAGRFIANLATLETSDAVDAYVIERVAKLSELQAKRPELHSQVMDAVAARKAELADDFTDTPDPAEKAAQSWIDTFAKCETVIDLDREYKASAGDRDAMGDGLREAVEGAYAEGTARLSKVAG